MAKTTTKTTAKTKLSLLDRLVIPGLFTKPNNYVSLKLQNDIKGKIQIEQPEILKYKITPLENGGVSFNESGTKAVFEYEFTELEKNELKQTLVDLDSNKQLTAEHISLYETFVK